MTDWRKPPFRCLVRGTFALLGIVLIANGPAVLHSWRLYSRVNEDKWMRVMDLPSGVKLSSTTDWQLSRKRDVSIAVFNCNPYWLTKLGLDKRPNRYFCPNSRRQLTVKSAYRDVEELRDADVVIFSAWLANQTLWDDVVKKRKHHQLWVYSTAESAYSSPQVRDDRGRPVGFGNFRFNISFGYHSFSNVVAPFGEYRPTRRQTKRKQKPVDYFKKKRRLVSWVSSHCGGQFWNRTAFVRSLGELIPVDMFGACGEMQLPRGPVGTAKMAEYKFNLALENSCCSEYITEKLWHSLAHFQSVPVVLGPSRADYERVAPPNSFIFAGDFKSLSDLSRYLWKLSRNASLYNQFHEWRRHGNVTVYDSHGVYPFTSKESSCAMVDFIEKTVSNHVGEDTIEIMKFDPFSSEWLGSCRPCGENDWLAKFNTNPDAFNPTLRRKNQRNL